MFIEKYFKIHYLQFILKSYCLLFFWTPSTSCMIELYVILSVRFKVYEGQHCISAGIAVDELNLR